MSFVRTTVYKGLKRPDGKLVVLDVAWLSQTSKVVDNARDYEVALGTGWADSPQEAMARLERAEDQIAIDAAVSASDDKRMSPAAQAEVADYERSTLAHVLEIPEAPKARSHKRRPPKG